MQLNTYATQCNPINVAVNASFSNVGCTSMDVTFTSTSTTGATVPILIFAQQTSTCPLVRPSCGTAYTASTTFGSGTQNPASSGSYCVYVGTITASSGATVTLSVTGLSPLTTYSFSLFSYCGNTAASPCGGASAAVNTYNTSTSKGCGTQATSSSPIIAAIAGGASNICVGTPSPIFTDATGGGIWSITNGTGSASIDSTYKVTGISDGTATVVYSITSGGCTGSVSYPITIATPPTVDPISGATSVCVGDVTSLSSSTSGGTWSVVNGTGSASIDASGNLTTTGTGTVTAYYTVTSNGCPTTVSSSITINSYPTVPNIGGAATLCEGSSTTFTNGTSGGTWWVTPGTGSATIDGTTGVLTGQIAGTVTVNYSVTNNGCITTKSTPLIINAQPTVSAITGGASTICTGNNTTFSNATSGGTWSSSNTSVATINSGGVVTPLTSGTVTISYTVSNGTCTNSATTSLSVTSGGSITDNTGAIVCNGSSRSLTASGSGQWYQSSDGITWTAISGATSSTYTTPALTYPNSYYYKVQFSGCASSVLTRTPNNNGYATATGGYACNGSFTMNGGGAATGTWELVSGSGTITSSTSPTTTVTGLGTGQNLFKWTVTNGGCTSSTTVSVTRGAGEVTVSKACLFTPASVDLTANYTSGTLQWQVSTDGGTTWTNIAGATSSPYTTSSLSTSTSYLFRVQTTNGACVDNSKTVSVNAGYCSTACKECTTCNTSYTCDVTLTGNTSYSNSSGNKTICISGTYTGSFSLLNQSDNNIKLIVPSGAVFNPSSFSATFQSTTNIVFEVKSGGSMNLPNGILLQSSNFTFNNCGTVTGTGGITAQSSTVNINNSGTWNAPTSSLLFQTSSGGTVCNNGTMTVRYMTLQSTNTLNNSGTLNITRDLTMQSSSMKACPNSVTNVTRDLVCQSCTVTGIDDCATINVTDGSTWQSSTLTGVNICDSKGSGTPAVQTWQSSTYADLTYCSCTTYVPLPVSLLFFNARTAGDAVKLYWITSSEINNDFFTIERTLDGSFYEVVDIVKGAGNSTVPLNYHTIDEHPFNGISYYRLKQTDFDGSNTYSQLVAVNFEDNSDKLQISYFNPRQDMLIYQVSGAEEQDLYVQLVDPLGRTVYAEKIDGGSDDRGFRIDISNLTKGVYLFKVTDGEQQAVKKFFY